MYKFFARVCPSASNMYSISAGIPGSVLGPALFTTYVSPIGRLTESLGTEFHACADDTQIYTVLMTDMNQVSRGCRNPPWHYSIDCGKMSYSTVTSRTWLSTEWGQVWRDPVCRLRYSSQVAQLMYPRDCMYSASRSTPHYHSTIISPVWSEHAISICVPCATSAAASHTVIANTTAWSIIGGRLDYCNALLFDVPAKTVSRLQRVQNNFAANSLWHRHQQTSWLPVELTTYYVNYTGYRYSPEWYIK